MRQNIVLLIVSSINRASLIEPGSRRLMSDFRRVGLSFLANRSLCDGVRMVIPPRADGGGSRRTPTILATEFDSISDARGALAVVRCVTARRQRSVECQGALYGLRSAHSLESMRFLTIPRSTFRQRMPDGIHGARYGPICPRYADSICPTGQQMPDWSRCWPARCPRYCPSGF